MSYKWGSFWIKKTLKSESQIKNIYLYQDLAKGNWSTELNLCGQNMRVFGTLVEDVSNLMIIVTLEPCMHETVINSIVNILYPDNCEKIV